MNAIIGALIRHALSAVGAGGVVGGNDVEQIAGALSLIISVTWSIIEKKNRPVDPK